MAARRYEILFEYIFLSSSNCSQEIGLTRFQVLAQARRDCKTRLDVIFGGNLNNLIFTCCCSVMFTVKRLKPKVVRPYK